MQTPVRKNGYADYREVESIINQSIIRIQTASVCMLLGCKASSCQIPALHLSFHHLTAMAITLLVAGLQFKLILQAPSPEFVNRLCLWQEEFYISYFFFMYLLFWLSNHLLGYSHGQMKIQPGKHGT